jgi:hypothetical protein
MNAETLYGEYIEHPSIPGGRAWVGMPKGKSMTLGNTAHTWRHEFRNRKACLRWLAANMPDALAYRFSDGITICGGHVGGIAELAGAV